MTPSALEGSIKDIFAVIRSGVGLSSRVGAASFLLEMIIERGNTLFTDVTLRRVFNVALDISFGNAHKEQILRAVASLLGAVFKCSDNFKGKHSIFLFVDTKQWVEKIRERVKGKETLFPFAVACSEVVRNVSEGSVRQEEGALLKPIYSLLFILKFTDEEATRKQARRIAEIIEQRFPNYPVE